MSSLEFLLRYSDEERHPIIADNDDWDSVVESLSWLEGGINNWAEIYNEESRLDWMNSMRVLFEALYVAGYHRGKEESKG